MDTLIVLIYLLISGILEIEMSTGQEVYIYSAVTIYKGKANVRCMK